MKKIEKIITEIPSSKSLYNRALIVQSFFPQLELQGQSTCEDVIHAQEALKAFANQQDIYCGEGGTTFRFVCLRVSRVPGVYRIFAKKRLLERPQKGLIDLLAQLNTQVTIFEDHYLLDCKGWQGNLNLVVDTSVSSQFASAVVLCAWNYQGTLRVALNGERVSEGYLQMTLRLLTQVGMEIHFQNNVIEIPPLQKIKVSSYRVESDVSSAFSVAAIGVLNHGVEFLNFPFNSDQPDLEFLNILQAMGVEWVQTGNSLYIPPVENLKPIERDLFNCPDLFPVLAVLCASAQGDSRLFNAPQLVAKESDRIAKSAELLTRAGFKVTPLNDGMIIHGGQRQIREKFIFDPDNDHRMVMAAQCLITQGVEIEVLQKSVVNKSFPEYWKVIGESF